MSLIRKRLFKIFFLTIVLVNLLYLYSYYYSKSNVAIKHIKLNNEFKKELKTELKTEIKSENKKLKYLIYVCKGLCGGLADRFKGILSSYAWSLLSDRIFIIHMKSPCNFENLMIPNEVKWNTIIQVNKNTTYKTYSLVDRKSLLKKFEKIDFIKEDEHIDVLFVKINHLIVNKFLKNNLIKYRLNRLGFNLTNYNEFKITKLWLNKLFKLNADLNKKYLNYLQLAKPNKNSTLICTQVRIGGKRPHVSNDRIFLKRNITKLFWYFIKEKFIKPLNNSNYKIFLTTDTQSVQTEAFQVFGEKLFRIDGLFVHFDKDGRHKFCYRYEKVILDFYFYRNCDFSLISPSGYGILANAQREKYDTNFYNIRDI